ncbi:MAG: hypothetical protein LBO77_02665 [Desulfovibrio sp.]|jgi:hypothetical protein|nr:hypothetical protein [Desulfovibrio sp.]
MISSFFDGRVRIRSRALSDPATLESVTRLLEAQPGVRRIAANARTGSLLVEYDPQILSREKVQMAMETLSAHLGEE